MQMTSYKNTKNIFCIGTLLSSVLACNSAILTHTSRGTGAINCFDSNCIAVGQYYQTGNTAGLPLISMSNNYGRNFNILPSYVLPVDADPSKNVQLYGVNCFADDCVAVGVYNLHISAPPINSLPLAMFSTNAGRNFTKAVSVPLPDDKDVTKIAGLRTVAMSNSYIVAGGLYNFDVNTGWGSPFIAVANKNGNFFKTYKANLPSDQAPDTHAQIYSISCVEDHCVAVGTYTATANTVPYPLILLSNDGGLNFNQFSQISISSVVDTTDITKGMYLKSVNCEGLNCIAVGHYYQTGVDGTSPFVLLSNDGGEHFSMNSTVLLPIDTDNTLNAGLQAISCEGLRCVGGGYYNFDAMTYSLKALYVFSNDGGLTFTSAPTTPLPAESDATKSAEITGISCIGENCVGVGIYNLEATMAGLSGLPLTLFSGEENLEFDFAAQPRVPVDLDSTKLNVFGDILP